MSARRLFVVAAIVIVTVAMVWVTGKAETSGKAVKVAKKPLLESVSALAFGPNGILFVGDAKAGKVFAFETGDKKKATENARVNIQNVEKQLGALLGSHPSDVLIHDLAVNPISQNIYLAVSRERGKWDTRWELPNDIADAQVIVRIEPDSEMKIFSLESLGSTHASLPNPVSFEKTHKWKKGVSLRADAITDLAYANGTLYVAGLSNEEFSSAMWKFPYPFKGEASVTTLEVFHGAHGEYETHAPIRTFVPYDIKGERHLLAAYLCTPFATFKDSQLEHGKHVKGRTLAEFGSGNYPLDMIAYEKNGKEKLLIANSNLPLMIVDPVDVANFEGSIVKEVEGYTAGLDFEFRSGTGIQQLDKLNADFVVALQRLPGGTMDLVSASTLRY